MGVSDTQSVEKEQIASDEPPADLKSRVEELEERLQEMEDRFESIQRRNDEEQFNQQSNFGY